MCCNRFVTFLPADLVKRVAIFSGDGIVHQLYLINLSSSRTCVRFIMPFPDVIFRAK